MQTSITKKSILQGILVSLLLLLMTGIVRGIQKDGTMLLMVLWSVGIGLAVSVKIKVTEEKIWNYLVYLLPAAGLAIWALLCVTPNLWYDEAYSAALVSNDIQRIWEITSNDVHPPLYYFILKAAYELCGHSIQSLKAVSLLFLEAYLLLGMFPIRRIFGAKTAAYFEFFSLCMPCMTVHSTNVRMYTLALFAVMLTGILAYEAYREAGIKRWIYLGMASIVGIYVHTYTMISIMFVYLILFGAILYQKKKEKILPFCITGIVTAVSYLPWLRILLVQFQNRTEVAAETDVFTSYEFINYFTEWFSSTERPYPLAVLFGCGLCIFLGYLAVDKIRREREGVTAFGLLVFALTVAAGVFVSAKFAPSFMGRYALPAIGFVWLFWAYGMCELKDSRAIGAIVMTVILIGALNYREEWKLEYDKGLHSYQTFLEANISEEDAIMVPAEHELLLNIYHPDLQYFIYGYKAPNNPFQNTEAFKEYSQLDKVTGDIWYICFPGGSPYLLEERYGYEEAFSFHYQYYDFVIYRLIRK